MIRSKTAALILLVALGLGAWLRLGVVEAKGPMEHDDAISYLAASGHQGEFHTYIDEGAMITEPEWRQADFWQRMMRPEDPFVFGRIAEDLIDHDIHPPMYFWVLHLWMLVFGTSAGVGPALNVALATLTTIGVFLLGRTVVGDERYAALGALLYAILPGAVAVAFLARQYDLLALITVYFLWLVALVWEDGRVGPGRVGAAVLLGAVGMLTHYHFILVAAFGLGALAYRLRDRMHALIALGGSAVGAVALTFLLQPRYLEPVLGISDALHEFTWRLFGFRWLRTLHTVSEGVALPAPLRDAISERLVPYYEATGGLLRWSTVALEVLVVAALVALLVAGWRRRRRDAEPADRERADAGRVDRDRRPFPIRLAALWMFGVTAGLYLAFRSPQHAMTARYLAHTWPLLAVAATASLHRFVGGVRLQAAVAVALLAPLSLVTVHSLRVGNDPTPYLVRAEALVFDNPARGIWLPFVWEASPGMPVFVDDAEHLLEDPDLWVDWIADDGMFVDHRSYHVEDEVAEELSGLFQARQGALIVHVPLWERYHAWMPEHIAEAGSAAE